MTHDSTRLGRTRAGRGARTVTALTFALGCMLIVLAGFASVASASNPEMRGEWELVLKTGTQNQYRNNRDPPGSRTQRRIRERSRHRRV